MVWFILAWGADQRMNEYVKKLHASYAIFFQEGSVQKLCQIVTMFLGKKIIFFAKHLSWVWPCTLAIPTQSRGRQEEWEGGSLDNIAEPCFKIFS